MLRRCERGPRLFGELQTEHIPDCRVCRRRLATCAVAVTACDSEARARSSIHRLPIAANSTVTGSPAGRSSRARSRSSGREIWSVPTRTISSPGWMPSRSAGLVDSTFVTRSGPSEVVAGCVDEAVPLVLQPLDVQQVAATLSASSIGIAKPMPWAPARTATLTPIISPSMFSSGPPELPGLMLASV